MRHTVAAIALLVTTSALAEGPAQLVSIDPLTQPAATLLEPMRFAVDNRTPAEKIQPMLWEEAVRRGPDATIPIIVTLYEPLLPQRLRGTSAEADNHRVQWVASLAHEFAPRARAVGMTNLRALSHFPILFGRARRSELRDLSAVPGVRAVEFDAEQRAFRTEGSGRISSLALRMNHSANGNGIEVAVVDSGVDPHPEFASRMRAQQDLTGTTGRFC